MSAPLADRPRIQAPEVQAHDDALANLRAAESLITQALDVALAAQWAWPIRCDIARIQGNLRSVLRDLS